MQTCKFMPIRWVFSVILIGILVISAVSCTTNTNSESGDHAAGEHEDEHTADGHEGEHEHEEGDMERIPNEGASLHIQSPANEATFQSDQEILVEIEVENFAIGEDGNHWELYVDDSRWSSVEGGTQEVVRGLEPGEHEISVFLANGEHQELEEGATITIIVSE